MSGSKLLDEVFDQSGLGLTLDVIGSHGRPSSRSIR
jgi:hypothetical protein